MAESEYARNMRLYAEAQTQYAEQTLEQAQQQTRIAQEQLQQQALETAYVAAAEERRAEEAQAHNFAMWRAVTPSGQAYANWLVQAQPLVREFDRRWRLWQAALIADRKTVYERRESESVARFGLKSKRFRTVKNRNGASIRGLLGTLALGLGGAILLSPVLGLIFGTINSYFEVPFLGPILDQQWSIPLIMVYLPLALYLMFVVFEVFFQFPRAKNQDKMRSAAKIWVDTETSSFSAQLPNHWLNPNDYDEWTQLVNAEKLIDDMPEFYVDVDHFYPPVLPERLPRALSSDSLPAEASRTRSLLSSWHVHE